jgi:hypothetical protein
MTLKEYNNGVKLWADDVYRYAAHCCGDPETAKDGVQEAFAALWEHRDQVSTDKGKAFLMSVVHNWAMSLHRHAKVHQENAYNLMGETVALPDTSFDLREALQTAAAQLPEIQRSALMLKDVEGVRHNYAYFPVFISEEYGLSRDALYEKLKEHNIYGRRYFYPLISTFSAYKGLESADPKNLPIAHKLADQVLCLPMFAGLDEEGAERVIDVVTHKK